MPTLETCYSTNYLAKVILRADFGSNPTGPLEEATAFADKVAHLFPHSVKNSLVEMQVNITENGNDVAHKHVGTQWTLTKAIGSTMTVSLQPTFLSLEYGPGDYVSFPAFFAEFQLLIDKLTEAFGNRSFDRIGLRYINEIRLPGRALDWNGIIHSRLVGAVLTPALENGRLIRSMHQIVERHGENQIHFNYGIVNPDFPAPVVQRFFVLDIDCSREGVLNRSEALDCIQQLNDLATLTFESSIEQGFRQILGVVNA